MKPTVRYDADDRGTTTDRAPGRAGDPTPVASESDIRYFERSLELPVEGRTCIDLFSGAGGLAEGFRQAGYSVLSGSDIDSKAGRTFQANFPEASFFEGPVAALDPDRLLEDADLARGELDCLIGGPPCQAFSYNNHQRSVEDIRAGLFRDYLAIVKALNPKTLVMENVPGILSLDDGSVVDEVYKSLDELGYECEARILYAEDFGVPQERRRVFFIATRLGWDDALFPDGTHGPVEKPLPESNSFVHRWEPSADTSTRLLDDIHVWAAISDLPEIDNGDGKSGGLPYSQAKHGWLQNELRDGNDAVTNHLTRNLGETVLERIREVPAGGSWRDIPYEKLPDGMKRADRNSHTTRYGRPKKTERSCTILTKCDPHWGAYIHPTQHRVFSIREAARLQSFPDHFHFTEGKEASYLQVGNAVPPLVARAIGNSVDQHIQTCE